MIVLSWHKTAACCMFAGEESYDVVQQALLRVKHILARQHIQLSADLTAATPAPPVPEAAAPPMATAARAGVATRATAAPAHAALSAAEVAPAAAVPAAAAPADAAAAPIGAASITQLSTHWWLCADHKLLCLALGHGGTGCNRPCPFCDWHRGGGLYQQLDMRTALDVQRAGQLAERYAQPLRNAQLQVKQAKAQLDTLRKSKKADAAAVQRLQDSHAEAEQARDQGFALIKQRMEADGQLVPATVGEPRTVHDLFQDAAVVQAAAPQEGMVNVITEAELEGATGAHADLFDTVQQVGHELFEAKAEQKARAARLKTAQAERTELEQQLQVAGTAVKKAEEAVQNAVGTPAHLFTRTDTKRRRVPKFLAESQPTQHQFDSPAAAQAALQDEVNRCRAHQQRLSKRVEVQGSVINMYHQELSEGQLPSLLVHCSCNQKHLCCMFACLPRLHRTCDGARPVSYTMTPSLLQCKICHNERDDVQVLVQ